MKTRSRATPAQRKGRLILSGIAAVFVIPVIVAAIFTMGPLEWQTNRTVNYERLLDQATQIQTAIGRDRTRVEVALLSPQSLPAAFENPRWLLGETDRFVRELHAAADSQQQLPVLLIVDHRRRVALMYPPKDHAQDALRDLKRLLKSSAPP